MNENNVKKGLILEGGAMRGMFTCGVIDVFLENNIEFDGMVGVSAGATFGCNFVSKQIGRGLRYNMAYGRDKRYASFSSLIKTGDYYGAEFCYETLPQKLDPFDYEALRNNPMEFWVTATDLDTGRAVYHKFKDAGPDDMKWMRASASMPLFSSIVEIGDRRLLDGGIADSIPLQFFENKGYNRNVVVTTQPNNYVKKKNSAMAVIKAVYRKYPNLIKAMATRHLRYNRETEYIRSKAAVGKVFLISPEESLNISHTEKNPAELERVYLLGRKAAEKRLEELKKYLG